MKNFCELLPALIVSLLITSVNAQRPDEVLATSTGTTYQASSLSPGGRRLYTEQRKVMADARSDLLTEMIITELLDLESKAMSSTPAKLLAAQRTRVPQPTATEIQSFYDTNRSALGGRPLDAVREQIVGYLKQRAEQKLVEAFIESLRTKYKVVMGKDVNSVGLGPQEILVTIGTKTIPMRDFEQANRIRLNDAEMRVYEDLRSDLELSIFSTLVSQDAKARNIDAGTFIATEITDKLRTFTTDERAAIESALMRRLFAKYNVKILLREPTPIVHSVSVDDDPQIGSPTAPVTVVMFTDFQCSGCSGTHPVLKQALQGYGDKVRLVVRDFPLESIHENAFAAALAANAARLQGKFTEYTEILYRNQDTLDKASLVRYATELGLNVKQFELDFSDAKTAAEVRKDQADGRTYGIGGTPAIFVNGVKVHRLSLNGFRSAIDRALAK